jgi:hypothetical protein
MRQNWQDRLVPHSAPTCRTLADRTFYALEQTVVQHFSGHVEEFLLLLFFDGSGGVSAPRKIQAVRLADRGYKSKRRVAAAAMLPL